MVMSEVPVVVIVGAGASLVSGTYDETEAPPLTAQLFDHPHALQLLPQYPLAQMAGRHIQRRVSADDPVALEEILLELRTSGNPQRKHMAEAVPLYLQHLLFETSARLHWRAERYDSLIDALSEIPRGVLYVTLNYDTLLDGRLDAFRPLDSFNDYLGDDWSLYKLHGSVTWSATAYQPFDPSAPPPNMTIDRSAMACVSPKARSLDDVRVPSDAPGLTRRYPALALPEGPKDELILPRHHERDLRQRLAGAPEIDVLVLGYSALDTEVLQLLRDSGTRVRRLTVVNRDARAGLGVFDTIAAFGLTAVWPDIFDGSLAQWIDGGAMQRWVSEYGGPYETITEPEHLRQLIPIRELEEFEAQRREDGWHDQFVDENDW
jgi:hypothetical protein